MRWKSCGKTEWCGSGSLASASVSRPTSSAVSAADQAESYLGPSALVVSPDAKTLYVACTDARQVAWVELPGGTVARRITVPAEPTGLALSPDGTKLIVTCAAPKSTIAVLDAGSGETLATIPAGHTAGATTLSPDGTRLYVCNRFDHNVSVIDLPAAREIARVAAVREPVAVTVTPDGRTVLVANHLPNTRTDSDVYRRRGGRCLDLRCPDLCDRRHRTARRRQRPARDLHVARRNPRLGNAPAVQLPDGSVPRGHGLDQRERGQHHRRAAAQAGGHDWTGRILLGRGESVGLGLYRRR